MSNIDDTNKSPEPAEDADVQTAEPTPETSQRRKSSSLSVFTRVAAIAGAAAAVVAVLGLTFGAGVWAGSQFGDEYGRDGRGHSESRSHNHEADEDDGDIDQRWARDGAESQRPGDDEGKSSDGQQVRRDGERVQAPASSSATPVPAPTASGRS